MEMVRAKAATAMVSSRGLSPGPMVLRSVSLRLESGARCPFANNFNNVHADRWVPGTSPGMTTVGGLVTAAQRGTVLSLAEPLSLRLRSRPNAATVTRRRTDAVSAREPGSLPAGLKLGGCHDQVKIPDKPAFDMEGYPTIRAGFPGTRGFRVVFADRWVPATSPGMTTVGGLVTAAQRGSVLSLAEPLSLRLRSRPNAATVTRWRTDAVSAREPGSLPAGLKLGDCHDQVKIPDKPALDTEGYPTIRAGCPGRRAVRVVFADRWVPGTSPVKTIARGFVAMAQGELA